MDKLVADGYLPEVVEKRIPGCGLSKDLFGCVDILALGNRETLAIQVTSASNVAARIKKVREADALPRMREAGWRVQVWGTKNGIVHRIEDIS